MTTKITAIIDNPASPDDFEADPSVLVTRARKMPGFQRMETTQVWAKEDGNPTPAYRPLGLYSPTPTAPPSRHHPRSGRLLPKGVRDGCWWRRRPVR